MAENISKQLVTMLDELDQLEQDIDKRPTIYTGTRIEDIIQEASQVKDIELQKRCIKTFEKIVKNEAELQMILRTSVLYFVVVILKETPDISLQADCLDLLAWFSQSEMCIESLISIHKI